MRNLAFDCGVPTEFDDGETLRPVSFWTRRRARMHDAPSFPEPLAPETSESMSVQQLAAVISSRLEQAMHLRRLEDQVAELSARVERLEGSAKTVFLQTFDPEPYVVLRPLTIVIEPAGEEFSASFFDANISTSGETEQEAFDNIRNLILDIFDSLVREETQRLGPEPRRQLAVLRSFVRGT